MQAFLEKRQPRVPRPVSVRRTGRRRGRRDDGRRDRPARGARRLRDAASTIPTPRRSSAGVERLRADLAKGAERGRWSDDEAEAAAARLAPAPASSRTSAGCDLVVEAAPEDARAQARRCSRASRRPAVADAVLATNTSSLSVTAIAAGAERPRADRAACTSSIPPALMRLVEVVAGERDRPEPALARATEVAERMGRTPCAPPTGSASSPTAPRGRSASRRCGCSASGSPTPTRSTGSSGSAAATGWARSSSMDLIGIDVNLAVARSFFDQSFGEPRWRPHPLQQRMVDSGRLGRKTGRGWYRYDDGPHRPDDPPPLPAPASTAAAGPGGRGRRALGRAARPRARRRGRDRGTARGRRRPRSAPPAATSPRSESTSSARRARPRGWCSAGSSASSSTRPASPSARGSGPRTTSTPRCGSASTTRAARSSGAGDRPRERASDARRARAELGADRYRPAPLLRRWAVAGGPAPPH